MKYIIHSNIIFDTAEYILTSLKDTHSPIKLSNSAGRILEELIKYRNTNSPVTREYLFTTIWKNHGLEASNGNLNQQISLIRKTLVLFGLDASSIITIPKRGLKLNSKLIVKNIPINNYNFDPAKNTKIQHNPSSDSASIMLLNFKTHMKYIITLIVIFGIISNIGFIYLYNKTNNIKLYCCKEINSCNICTVPAISGLEYDDYNIPYFEIT